MKNTKLLRFIEDFSLPLIFLVLFAGLSLSVEYFFSDKNMIGLALSVSQIGMVACTMMFCLASRDFDLSIGSTVAFAGVLCATVINRTDSVLLGVGVSLLAGAAIGCVNGVVIAKLRVNALITTLATMEIVRGLAFITSGGQAVGASTEAFLDLGHTIIFEIPSPVWITALCFVVFGVLLNKTVYGRNTLAIGGNPEAARLAGVSVDRTRILIFLIQGVVAALAGVILASRITSGQPNAAIGFELNVISACVLGGVSLMGGRASMSGVLVGVLIMGTVQNAMSLLNIDVFYQYLVRGSILLAAVLVDQLKNRGEQA
ncbi:L-arabinose ABC transporter permease AraH [Verminephrobacter aporrectodeae]|uniref:L-arabinose ABC transporter permease AraH n=1 Tax=Verminephrobacter aporrectodeae subsp. tuberculatae TaxID=1110392 RepID=A0ABT3KNZ2_9BURK|nr:L-arabinose ABC transporter permease AraH [Verminephrobacter aporrectodeae]MCW5221440.1 L-arabinose ABC transporter permease AraH [Verminephrobacter aporrectodeae subsp. tuberculatae]MCW5257750.1 L-arabinose ABC transporter permease AraH [Verminephrobacter aporrectodeae subsp. tuberculatae]MCW5290731.1 L-arabinose ABC transporter permease AraH [Verminephrobacter aporrectodeae subsp. tuberculatae]MCW5320036.1 L-arabinose ABC transporter permease AraH [Verminephrobacter aporrectodeae subsp. tu